MQPGSWARASPARWWGGSRGRRAGGRQGGRAAGLHAVPHPWGCRTMAGKAAGSWEVRGGRQDTLQSPAPCSCQSPAGSLLLALASRLQSHPWSHGSLPHGSLPHSSLPSEAAAQPFPPSLLWRETDLRLRFPRWKRNFFPCKLPLFCFVSWSPLTPLAQAGSPGSCLPGQLAGATVAARWLPGPPRRARAPRELCPCPCGCMAGCGSRVLFQGSCLGSASANWPSTKLQLQSSPPVPEGGRAAWGPSAGPGRAFVGSSIQLSRPGWDTDLSLGVASALAQVGLSGFSDRNGCYESPAHPGAPCLASQASDTSPRPVRRKGSAEVQTLLETGWSMNSVPCVGVSAVFTPQLR